MIVFLVQPAYTNQSSEMDVDEVGERAVFVYSLVRSISYPPSPFFLFPVFSRTLYQQQQYCVVVVG